MVKVIQKPSTKCDRKRSRLVCACGNREEEGTHDLSRRKATKRPFLGIFLASFMQPKVPAIEFLVANGKKRMRTTRLASLGFARLQGEPEVLGKSAQDYPDKKKLTSVQDFFRYTEAEGESTVNKVIGSCC
jgi:hypothetical protein